MADAPVATPWYATYRFYLSLIVGFSIIATFAGTGYYGAGAGATIDAGDKRYLHTTERISPLQRMQRVTESKHPKGHETMVGRATGTVKGDVEVEEEGEEGDNYLTFRNKKKEEEEAAEKEEEEKKAKEEEEKAKKDDKGNKGNKDKDDEGDKDKGDKGGKDDKGDKDKDDGSAKDKGKQGKGDKNDNEKADGKETSKDAKQGAKSKKDK